MTRHLCQTALLALFTLTLPACDRESQTDSPAVTAPVSATAPLAKPTHSPGDVTAQRLTQSDRDPGDWMSYGRDYSEQRFSPLSAINDRNAGALGLAWSYDLETRRGIESTSLVVDGVMYMTSSWSIVHAVDARTGKPLWTFDPRVPKEKAKHTCCDVVNRGVALWQGQLFFGTLDGHCSHWMPARARSTGKWPPSVRIALCHYRRAARGPRQGADRQRRRRIRRTRVSQRLQCRGRSLAWRFYTVPGDPALGFLKTTR
ncbi:MAG: hypothetical protein R3E50_04500 [Halioglobus sp.]